MKAEDQRSAPQLNSVRLGVRGAPLVVLIHAVGLDLTYWDGQIGGLGQHYDVIAYDLPGHGASTALPPGFGFADQSAALASIIRSAGAGPAHLVGLSVGGMIAQSLVIAEPDLVRSLVLIDTIATFPDPVRSALRDRAALVRASGMAAVVQQTLDRWFTSPFAESRPDVLDRASKTLLGCDPEVHAGMWDMIASLDVAPRLHEIDKPTLVLVGEHDPTTPVAASKAIADRISDADFSVLAAVSHMSPLEAPSLVTDHIMAFLARM